MSLRVVVSVIIALAALSVVGCQKKDSRLEPVKASSPSAFGRWRTMASDIKAEEWREFDALLQELRLRVTAEKRASGSEAVEAAMRADIDGKSFREVLLMGYEARLKRVVPERVEVELAMSENIRRAQREKDTTTAGDIQRMRERQDKRLKELDAEIAHAREQAAALRRLLGLVQPPETSSKR